MEFERGLVKVIGRLMLVAALALAPVEAASQARRQPDRATAQDARPLGFLLRHRTELGLSKQQVARMEAISRRLEEQNRPLREQLRAASERRRAELQRLAPDERRAWVRRLRQNGARPEVPPELRPVVERLRQNTQRAADESRNVLSEQQRQRARELRRAELRRLRETRGLRRPGAALQR